MLSDRNLTSHVYKEEIAEEIAKRIVNTYVLEYDALLNSLKSMA